MKTYDIMWLSIIIMTSTWGLISILDEICIIFVKRFWPAFYYKFITEKFMRKNNGHIVVMTPRIHNRCIVYSAHRPLHSDSAESIVRRIKDQLN